MFFIRFHLKINPPVLSGGGFLYRDFDWKGGEGGGLETRIYKFMYVALKKFLVLRVFSEINFTLPILESLLKDLVKKT